MRDASAVNGASVHIEMGGDDAEMFGRAARRLLGNTFILKEKEEKLYRFAAREDSRTALSEYFAMIGYDVAVEEKAGVIMLAASCGDEDAGTHARANLVRFTATQCHLLIVLWQTYLDLLGGEDGVYVTMGDLVDRMRGFGVEASSSDLRGALRLFRKHQLVSYRDGECGEDAKIRLYPSLQFGWDLPQFRTVASQYIESLASGDARGGNGGQKAPDA